MKLNYLFLFLLFVFFTQNGWAPPPGKGGAAANPDLKVVGQACGGKK